MTKFRVKLDKIRYKNDQLFTIAVAHSDEEVPEKYRNKGLIHQLTLKGYFPPNMSTKYLVNGDFEKNKYGFTFLVKQYEEIIDMTENGICNYLSSSIDGIGPTIAKRIYQKFGNSVFDIFDNSPERLSEVKGITAKGIEKIIESYKSTKILRDIMLLSGDAISPKLCGKIYKKFGNRSVEIIKTQPYLLCEINGISFITADKIARGINLAPDDSERIKQGILFVLKEAENQGHVCLPQKELVMRTLSLLNNGFESQVVSVPKIIKIVNTLAMSGCLLGDNGFAYLKANYFDEKDIAKAIVRKCKESTDRLSLENIEKVISEQEEKSGIKLHDQQREAVRRMVQNRFCIITGGPGTGKSTILQIAIETLKVLKKLKDEDFLLVAPTGKAARRMAETTNHKFESSTIHSALHLFEKDEDTSECDICTITQKYVFCDEASMIDNWLFARLMSATERSAVILLGDPEQLPSVGAGNVLADLLKCDIPKVKLTKIYRQEGTSSIAINAQKIRYGDFLLEYNKKDFQLRYADSEEEAANLIYSMFKGKSLTQEALNEIQILSPMKKKGRLAGSTELNNGLQEILNPYSPYKNEIKSGSTIFRTGDKVIQLKNRNEIDISNGDTGFIVSVADGNVVVDFGFSKVTYDKSELDQLALGYALSIHKSQGSEYKTVIIPVVTSFYIMLTRNLIYTGITRAKQNVILVGDKKAISIAISNNKQAERYTQLAARIKEQLNNE